MPDGDPNASPDWAHVHVAVNCARCGHDLHGQSEPKCPSCSLEFNWSDAAPVDKLRCGACDYQLYGLNETRCPECGTEFTWDEALDRYRRSRKPLFEYRWRDEPVRSLLRTWWWALWPPKIWNKVDIHDPPKLGPLLFIVVIVLVIQVALVVGIEGYDVWSYYRRIWQRAISRGWTASVPEPTIWAIPYYYFWGLGRAPAYALPTVAATLWLIASLVSLALFQQSMAKCSVQGDHIIRVWALTTLPVFPLFAALIALEGPRNMTIWLIPQDFIRLLPLFVVLVHTVWSLKRAYARYIRMQHSFWVATSSQIIAVLTTVIVVGLILNLG